MTNKLGSQFRKRYQDFEKWRRYANSRKQAHALRKEVIRRKGKSFVDNRLIDKIKTYAKQEFGSSGYWPWLALYAEMREDFIEGWVPDDYYTFEIIPRINPRTMAMVSTVKSFDHHLFNGFAIEPLAVRISGRFYDHEQNKLDDTVFYEKLMALDSEVVIKRDSSPSGGGVVFEHSGDVCPDDFNSRYNYVIQPSVRQHESINRLYGRSVNTIRVITYLADDGSVSIIFKAMRFGVNGLRIDNVNYGGWFFLLDEHGRAATNAYDALGFDAGENHPDTGFRYKDLAVPSFEQAVEKCKDSHRLFPYVGLIAWDVFIDENGIPGLIEWNAKCPGIWGNEALFGPLMLAFQNLKIGS